MLYLHISEEWVTCSRASGCNKMHVYHNLNDTKRSRSMVARDRNVAGFRLIRGTALCHSVRHIIL